ncbi:hypothetical protein AAKU55_003574 [Oxalobacteraceae bacterium GrIS 1.11]
MRLPGTRYQEPGWEQVRKLLGQCSLLAFKGCQMPALPAAALLDWYCDALAPALLDAAATARGAAAGNSYGESVAELALGLVYELRAQPGYWDGFVAALQKPGGAPWRGADAILRKQVNDLYAGLRDKVDSDNYQVALGRACSPNKMYTYRMLDTAYREIAALFLNWRQHAAQVAAILGRASAGTPIEARQLRSVAHCKPEWVIRWSATQEQFTGSPGPLHTKSKRFASLKNNAATIAAMMAEIGDYEELSSNLDQADAWQGEAGAAALWLEDYWRVMGEPEDETDVDDRILAAPAEQFDTDAQTGDEDQAEDGDPVALTFSASQIARDEAAASGVCLSPRYIELATAAQDGASWALQLLKDDTLAIRLSVYQKILGGADDSYPEAWRDPATGALPTLQQLAALDGISLPTLRKRRELAIARLQAANGTQSRRIL